MGEIKRHPYTSCAALACLGFCMVAIPLLYTQKADAGDVQQVTSTLSKDMADLRGTVLRESAQSELNSVRRELFDINMRIKALEDQDLAVELLLYQRRDDLLAQQRFLEAKLAGLVPKQ